MTASSQHLSERASTQSSDTRPAPWWKGAVIYQIYPRSFADSNNDGVGDLAGCTEKLAYVSALGVDAIWLSPFFTSPMRDFGYDVADYCAVDPSYGVMADFDRLLARAHELGLKVIIDLVYSHTSDQHAWFEESRSSKTNPKADWYVWADPKPDGSPPNNWQAVFGGACWEWDARRQQYYLHNFLTSQPDLNLHNQAVQDAMLDITRFWLDKGVDGFRIDAINFAMHDLELRDNPPAGRAWEDVTRPFDMQLHLYNQSHPNIVAFLERVRALTDSYPGRFTVAEVGGPDPIDEMRAFTADDRRLNSAYNFDFLNAKALTPALVRTSLAHWRETPGEGWPSWAFSNHDAPRHVSRWAEPGQEAAMARLSLMVLLSLRGNAFLYQGEELGLPQAEVPFQDLQDWEAIANWPRTLGRDGARTPMPWDHTRANAGFSDNKPWLPVDARHIDLAVTQQEFDPQSTLSFCRNALRFRRDLIALRFGTFALLQADADLIVIERRFGEARVLCLANMGASPIPWPKEAQGASLEFWSRDDKDAIGAGTPHALAPFSAYWATL